MEEEEEEEEWWSGLVWLALGRSLCEVLRTCSSLFTSVPAYIFCRSTTFPVSQSCFLYCWTSFYVSTAFIII
jgi:hypothetical protein